MTKSKRTKKELRKLPTQTLAQVRGGMNKADLSEQLRPTPVGTVSMAMGQPMLDW